MSSATTTTATPLRCAPGASTAVSRVSLFCCAISRGDIVLAIVARSPARLDLVSITHPSRVSAARRGAPRAAAAPARSARGILTSRDIIALLAAPESVLRLRFCHPAAIPTSTVLRGCAVRPRMSACLGTLHMALLYGNYFAATGAASPCVLRRPLGRLR